MANYVSLTINGVTFPIGVDSSNYHTIREDDVLSFSISLSERGALPRVFIEDAEVELIPVTLGFSLPNKFVACSETDAGVGVEVDTNGLFLVILYDGKDVSVLQLLHLCASEVVAVCYILDVSADDWCRNTKNLFAFRVKLEETFGAKLVPRFVTFQMSDDGFACKKVLLLLLIEYF